MIELRDVELYLDDRPVISVPDLKCNDGEIIGLIGRPGAGKSALLRMIGGAISEYRGEILLDGKSLRAISRKERRSLVASLDRVRPENTDETLHNFLLLARIAYKKLLEPYSDYDLQVVEEYLTLFEMSAYRQEPLNHLTDCILQCALLSFTLARQAPVLLLDNPTANLDIRSQRLLHRALSRVVMGGSTIVIVASNDINFILQTADRVFFMEAGRILSEEHPTAIEVEQIEKLFHAEVFLTRNIYNGRPSVHFFPES